MDNVRRRNCLMAGQAFLDVLVTLAVYARLVRPPDGV